MLQPIIHQLNCKRIVLASGSPRRQEILRNIVSVRADVFFCMHIQLLLLLINSFYFIKGLKVELCPSLFEENLDEKSFPTFSAFVEETALQKVLEVSHRLSSSNSNQPPPDIIIGADTMVTLGDKMYGKPETPKVAFETLSK